MIANHNIITLMTERTGQILEAVIQEYINTGEPVSSGALYDRYEFGIKPAMIRLELDELEERGYLEQPHHSAGRVPTNSGYEFFAKRVLGNNTPERSTPKSPKHKDLKQLLKEQAWPDLINELSTQLGLLSVAADRARDEVYKAGLERLIDNLDWQDHNGIRSVIHDFEGVDKRMTNVGQQMEAGPNIFIGKKSPVTNSESLSVVGGNYIVGDSTVTIFVIGPKRMDYKKVIQIFKNL
jgi:transcriptional regulator of heat shock response